MKNYFIIGPANSGKTTFFINECKTEWLIVSPIDNIGMNLEPYNFININKTKLFLKKNILIDEIHFFKIDQLKFLINVFKNISS